MDPSKKELYERAKELDIKGRGEMDTAELEAAVYAAEDDGEAAPETVDPATDQAPAEPEEPLKQEPDIEPAPEDAEAEGEPEVDFTERAGEVALEAGLTPEDFAGREPTGATGFTVADVRAVIAEREPVKQTDPNGVSRGDTVVYIDGNGEEHEVEVETVNPDTGLASLRVRHELLTVEKGTVPGTWKPKE